MSAQQERPGYPAPVLAAAILAAEGVSFLLVGSAALWLHGEAISVADADVVIAAPVAGRRGQRGQLPETGRGLRRLAAG